MILGIFLFVLVFIIYVETYNRKFIKSVGVLNIKNEMLKDLFISNRYTTLFDIEDKNRKAILDIASPMISTNGDWDVVVKTGNWPNDDYSSKMFHLTDNQLENLINTSKLSSEELKMKFLEDKFCQLVGTIDKEHQKTILNISIIRQKNKLNPDSTIMFGPDVNPDLWYVYKNIKHDNSSGFYNSAIVQMLFSRRKLHYKISDENLDIEVKKQI